MPYAARTTVPVDRTKTEIEQTLTRYGAERFAYFVEPKAAAVMFEVTGRRIRFNLPLDDGPKAERTRRQKWRALLLCIKAKLESVASGIETFEEAFLAHVVMPDNRTVYEHAAPRIAQIAKGGEMMPLLPGPSQ
jgi:hypothetical protein